MDEFAETSNRIRGYFEDLEPLKKDSVKNKIWYYAVSMVLFSILNECINAAEIFMSKKRYPAPISYREMAEFLKSKKDISGSVCTKMKKLFSKRNMLAHEYGEIEKEDIESLLEEISWARRFIAELEKKH